MTRRTIDTRSDGQEIGDRERDHDGEGVDLLEVGGRSGHQLAGLGAVVVLEIELLQLAEHRLTKIGLNGIGDLERQVPPEPGAGRREGTQYQDGEGIDQQPLAVPPVAHVVVDCGPGQVGHGDPNAAPEHADPHAGENGASMAENRLGQTISIRGPTRLARLILVGFTAIGSDKLAPPFVPSRDSRVSPTPDDRRLRRRRSRSPSRCRRRIRTRAARLLPTAHGGSRCWRPAVPACACWARAWRRNPGRSHRPG